MSRFVLWLQVYVQYKCKEPITLYPAQWKFPHVMIGIGLKWFLTGKGWAASTHLESGGFIRSFSLRLLHVSRQSASPTVSESLNYPSV